MTGSAFFFEYDSRNRVLAVRFRATVTDDVLAQFLQDVRAYVARYEIRSAIVDFSDADAFALTPAAIHRLARQPEAVADPTPRVVVAPRPIMFGVARLFKAESEGRDALHIVRSMAEAYRFLDLRDPHFEPVPAPDVV